MIRTDFAKRFWANHIPEPNSGCWLWEAAIDSDGYGLIRHRPPRTLAHRFSLKIATGENGDGLDACHRCDNTYCVNPDHLFWGTRKENMQDAKAKGRIVNHLADIMREKAHCPKGHLYDETNTRIARSGSRFCRTCSRLRMASKRAELKDSSK